jgi:hypothetical protein
MHTLMSGEPDSSGSRDMSVGAMSFVKPGREAARALGSDATMERDEGA